MCAEANSCRRSAPSPEVLDDSREDGRSERRGRNDAREESPEDAPDGASHQATLGNPPSLSAEGLHQILSKAHLVGHSARRKFILALCALAESRLYLELGFSSIAQYAERHFGSPRSLTYEYLRVAKALQTLPRCDRAFLEGKISWTVLREISQVADQETEGEWLELIEKDRSIERLKAEVRDAIKSGRRRPRRGKYGLPRVSTKFCFELDPEERDIAAKAVHMAAREMEASLGDETVEPKDALLFILRNFLETGVLGGQKSCGCGHGGGPGREEQSAYTILYQCCPDCRKSHLPTADGPVEIPEEVVRRVEGDATRVVISPEEEVPKEDPGEGSDEKSIAASGKEPKEVPPEERDRPNSRSLVTKIHLRDGGVCQNPLCRRRGHLHCHHIVFRVHGGRTALYNEVLLCSVCHSLRHAGLLIVEGNPTTGLVWKTKSDSIKFDFREELDELAAVPEVCVVGARAGGESPAAFAESAMADSQPRRRRNPDADLVEAMVGMGYSRSHARERLARAREQLTPEEAADEGLLLETAIRGRSRRPRPSSSVSVRN